VILDNRLNELLDPVTLFSANITLTGYASENNVWLYSQDQNILQLFDYGKQHINLSTQPLGFYQNGFVAGSMVTTNDSVWLIADDGILQFNQYASFIERYHFQGVIYLQPYRKGFIYNTDAGFFYYDGKKTVPVTIELPGKPKSFTVRNDKLYVFSDEVLSVFGLKE
jgi:dTDP-glucose pyrophosphorylase